MQIDNFDCTSLPAPRRAGEVREDVDGIVS